MNHIYLAPSTECNGCGLGIFDALDSTVCDGCCDTVHVFDVDTCDC